MHQGDEEGSFYYQYCIRSASAAEQVGIVIGIHNSHGKQEAVKHALLSCIFTSIAYKHFSSLSHTYLHVYCAYKKQAAEAHPNLRVHYKEKTSGAHPNLRVHYKETLAANFPYGMRNVVAKHMITSSRQLEVKQQL
ncbi:hypothetical protein Anapl_03532 [Anas platyrhynchos]|uniref:Uncharacterized protein n=1 Tax=Anas platyrhynchos TaxID=8839 RepID=R0K5U0_ANAPL|nr:hypothetical protein Anapl_03532 [Anas platyrhynchos]